MDKKEKAVIEHDYVCWVAKEAEKTGYSVVDISDIIRKYENKMKRWSIEINKKLAKLKGNDKPSI